MQTHSISYREFKGYKDRVFPVTLFRYIEGFRGVCIVLPGLGYTSHMPLLYYPTRYLMELGYDIWRFEYEYGRYEDFLNAPPEEKRKWALGDILSGLEELFKSERWKSPLVVIGKSLGTRVMGYLFSQDQRFKDSLGIWLTPVFKSRHLREELRQSFQRSLFVIGTSDPHYERAYIEELSKREEFKVLVFEEADHSLEIDGDLLGSIDMVKRVVEEIREIIEGGR